MILHKYVKETPDWSREVEEMSSKLNSEWQEMVSIPEEKQVHICVAERTRPVWGSTRRPSKAPSWIATLVGVR